MPRRDAGHVSSRRPLRLWPGVALAMLLVLAKFVLPLVMRDAAGIGVLAGIGGGLAILAWWLFFSRAPWSERVAAPVLMAVAVLAVSRVVHRSIENGMMGMMLPIFAVPLMGLALVASAAATRRLATGPRRAWMAAAIVFACALMTLVRTGGITGDGVSELHWRWTETPEERLLALAGGESPGRAVRTPAESRSGLAAGGAPATDSATPPPESRPSSPAERGGTPGAAAGPGTVSEPGARSQPGSTPASASESAKADVDRVPASVPEPERIEWPGFRGPNRDGVISGVLIDTDWSRNPPVELWRRPVGPGWSSFAVRGGLVYTQEQRGDDEMVSCYRLATGEPVWRHRDPVRFWESNGGAGPRGTPTLHGGRVYTFGATGIVNALDAKTGAVAWSRNAAADTDTKVPDWGFASSPLVIDGLVVVAAAGRLAAYDAATGRPRWLGPEGGGGYSSPHLAVIDGVPQVLLLRGARTIGVAPSDGALLWDHTWERAVSIVQPALVSEHDVLVAAGDAMGGMGIRRLSIAHGQGGWKAEERWTSRGLKPYFNDFVVHEGHAYGFDGSILACLDLGNGERKWKGGRYGHGQLVLLADEDLLLILSEDGELALARATPGQFAEVARVPALNGKTWNHPVLAGDVLLVRNGEEMAAFRLSRAGS